MHIDTLPSELFSHLLSFIDGPTRIALRLCSHSLEKAVAQSDLHVLPNSYKQRDITMRTWFGAWRMEFGEGLTVHLPYGDWDSALLIRKRLFNRGYATRLFINAMNFNEVPVQILLQLIEGIVYDTVHLAAVNEEFGVNFVQLIRHFRDKPLSIYVYAHMLDRETLLSLRAGTDLQIVEVCRYDGTHREESEPLPQPEWRVEDGLLLQLTLKKFQMLRIPVELRNEATIVEVIKLVSASDSPQCVSIKIPEPSMDRFLALIGMRRVDRMFYRNVGCEFQLKLAERVPFTHTLFYQNATVKAHYRKEEDQTVISLVIENSQYTSL